MPNKICVLYAARSTLTVSNVVMMVLALNASKEALWMEIHAHFAGKTAYSVARLKHVMSVFQDISLNRKSVCCAAVN